MLGGHSEGERQSNEPVGSYWTLLTQCGYEWGVLHDIARVLLWNIASRPLFEAVGFANSERHIDRVVRIIRSTE